MPEFDTYVDVDVDDFISACSKREITELVDALIDEGHIPASAGKGTNSNVGVLESIFIGNALFLVKKHLLQNHASRMWSRNMALKKSCSRIMCCDLCRNMWMLDGILTAS